jgi:hypothetical protein
VSVEPELCKDMEDPDNVPSRRDVQDCGKIILHLVTKTKRTDQRPDATRYSSHLLDFIDSTASATATALRQVLISMVNPLSGLADSEIASVSEWTMAQERPGKSGVTDGNVSSPVLR